MRKILLKIAVILTVIIAVGANTTGFAAAAISAEDYQNVIFDLPMLGERNPKFPAYIEFCGDPSYAGSFNGVYNQIEINGYVRSGLVASIVIKPVGENNENIDCSIIVQRIVDKYGNPTEIVRPEFYEWKYSLNDMRWQLMYFCKAGVISGQAGY